MPKLYPLPPKGGILEQSRQGACYAEVHACAGIMATWAIADNEGISVVPLLSVPKLLPLTLQFEPAGL